MTKASVNTVDEKAVSMDFHAVLQRARERLATSRIRVKIRERVREEKFAAGNKKYKLNIKAEAKVCAGIGEQLDTNELLKKDECWCSVCGEMFFIADRGQYVYKKSIGNGTKYCCSNKCYNILRKRHSRRKQSALEFWEP